MQLNLFTGKKNHTLIDTVEAPDTLIGIVPITSDKLDRELYPRIVDITLNVTCKQMDIQVKVPKGLSARFVNDYYSGQYFIEPVLLS